VELDTLFDRHIALAGDRLHGEDASLLGGVAWVGEFRCVFIACQGPPTTAAAYGKAARMVRLAEQTGAPCVLVGSAATLHLASPHDARSSAAFDLYLTTLATARAVRVAVADGVAGDRLEDTFDAVVGGPDTDDATGVAAVRSKLATTLAEMA